jgi:hypothetical protein
LKETGDDEQIGRIHPDLDVEPARILWSVDIIGSQHEVFPDTIAMLDKAKDAQIIHRFA